MESVAVSGNYCVLRGRPQSQRPSDLNVPDLIDSAQLTRPLATGRSLNLARSSLLRLSSRWRRANDKRRCGEIIRPPAETSMWPQSVQLHGFNACQLTPSEKTRTKAQDPWHFSSQISSQIPSQNYYDFRLCPYSNIRNWLPCFNRASLLAWTQKTPTAKIIVPLTRPVWARPQISGCCVLTLEPIRLGDGNSGAQVGISI
jgi:hypothetical protein